MAYNRQYNNYSGGYNNRVQPMQYQSFFNPIPLDFVQTQLDKSQKQYDDSYNLSVANNMAYRNVDVMGQDTNSQQNKVNGFVKDMNKMVNDEYKGDWGAASKKIAGYVGSIRKDSFWADAAYNKKHQDEAIALKRKLQAEGKYLGFNEDIFNQSTLDADGNSRRLHYEMQSKLNDRPELESLWNQVKANSYSSAPVVYTDENGNKFWKTANSKGVYKSRIDALLPDMMERYKDTANYKQRFREYTEINGMTNEAAQAKIKSEVLGAGREIQYSESNDKYNAIVSSEGESSSDGNKLLRSMTTTADITNKDVKDYKKKLRVINGDDDILEEIENAVSLTPSEIEESKLITDDNGIISKEKVEEVRNIFDNELVPINDEIEKIKTTFYNAEKLYIDSYEKHEDEMNALQFKKDSGENLSNKEKRKLDRFKNNENKIKATNNGQEYLDLRNERLDILDKMPSSNTMEKLSLGNDATKTFEYDNKGKLTLNSADRYINIQNKIKELKNNIISTKHMSLHGTVERQLSPEEIINNNKTNLEIEKLEAQNKYKIDNSSDNFESIQKVKEEYPHIYQAGLNNNWSVNELNNRVEKYVLKKSLKQTTSYYPIDNKQLNKSIDESIRQSADGEENAFFLIKNGKVKKDSNINSSDYVKMFSAPEKKIATYKYNPMKGRFEASINGKNYAVNNEVLPDQVRGIIVAMDDLMVWDEDDKSSARKYITFPSKTLKNGNEVTPIILGAPADNGDGKQYGIYEYPTNAYNNGLRKAEEMIRIAKENGRNVNTTPLEIMLKYAENSNLELKNIEFNDIAKNQIDGIFTNLSLEE